MSKYLGGEVLEHGGEIDRSAGADSLGVTAFLQEPGDTADGELEAGLDGLRHGLLPLAASPASGALA